MNPHFQRGLLLLQQHRPDMAEAEVRRGLADEPQSAWGHVLLSLCLKGQRKFEPALAEAELAIHLDPEMAFAHYARSEALFHLGRMDRAQHAIEEAIRLDPREPDYHVAKGWIYYNQRLWQSALGCAETGLACDPEHVDCHNLRSMALVKLGRKEEALGAAEESLARDPENAGAHAVQGWNYLEHDEPKKALEHFREALRLDPTLEYARHGLVEALKAKNFFYRWVLRYFLWMAKLAAGARWAVVIGLLVFVRVLNAISKLNPAFEPVAVTVIVLYFTMCYVSWVAEPLSNLLLRFNRFGRYALSAEETRAANWFGAFFFAGVLGLVLLFVLDDARAGWFGLWAGSMTIPVAIAFAPANRKSRSLPLIAFALGLIGLSALAAYVFRGPGNGYTEPLVTTYILLWVGLTWFGNSEWFRTH